MTLGLPFYGRDPTSGDWQSYEDIVAQMIPFDPARNSVPRAGHPGRTMVFNGVELIRTKVREAQAAGFGGVMIWEAGQDCRVEPVTRGGKTHPVTCPGNAAATSLLVAGISAVLAERFEL
jgi:hypothetical protein